MYHIPNLIPQLLALLAAAPPRMAELTAELSPAQLRTAPTPDEWSATDILAHLRACADIWGDCIARILAEDEPTFRAVNPRTWIEQTDYPQLEFAPSLAAFAEQRAALLAVLEPLPPEAWLRAATVKGAGRTLRRTVFSYADWLASHEQSHVKQIARLAKAMRA
ncbi:MAG: DinB family protein [Candidatus Promineofilum sp.]|nr:DinB family protein [Promineifilum sp.]